MSCSLRVNDDDAVTLHDTHHGLDRSGINYELLLGDRAAKLEPVAPCRCPEYELTGNEVCRSSLGKAVDDHGVEIRLMIGDNDDRAFVINEFHVGLYLDMRISAYQRNDYARAQKSKIEFARHTSYIIIARRLRAGSRITHVFLHLTTPCISS